jgi:hypothetical protein
MPSSAAVRLLHLRDGALVVCVCVGGGYRLRTSTNRTGPSLVAVLQREARKGGIFARGCPERLQLHAPSADGVFALSLHLAHISFFV